MVAVAKPAKSVISRVREFFFGKRCVDCGRLESDETTEATFRGPRRNGLCPRCNARYYANRPQNETKAARYDAELIRRGRLVTKKVAKYLRENTFTRVAREAQKAG